MKSARVNDWLQIVGLFGVIASLVFVGLQLNQSHEIALAQIYQERTASLLDWQLAHAANDLALSAESKAKNGSIDSIEPIELLAQAYMVGGAITLWGNSHYQYVLGYLPEEHWARVRVDIRNRLADPLWGPRIQSFKHFMRASFRASVEEIERALAAEAGN
jgi:hypothetical protein